MAAFLLGNSTWFAGAQSPAITFPTSLPSGTVGTAYTTTQFLATGASPITWSVTGGTLPSGLTFSSSGLLSGVPTAAASGSITFTATNAIGSANAPLSLTVSAALGAAAPLWLSSITGAGSTVDEAIDSGAIYVATTGSDTTGTGSISSPVATIAKAVDLMNVGSVAGAGKTIYLRNGTYAAAAIDILCGNALSPTKIKRYPTESVTITGSLTESFAFFSYGSALEVYGITFSGYLEHVINLESSGTSYRLINLTFSNCGSIIKTTANCNGIDIRNILYSYTGSSVFAPIDCSIGLCDNLSLQLCSISCVGSSQTSTNGIDIGPSGNITINKCFVDGVKGHAVVVASSRGNCSISSNYLRQSSSSGKNLLKVYPGFNDTGSGGAYSCVIETNVLIRTPATVSTDPLLFLENSLGSAIVRRNSIINESATPATTVLDDCGGSSPLEFGLIANVADGDGVAFTHTTPTVNANGDFLMDVTCNTLTPHGLSVGDAFAVAKTIVRSTNSNPAAQINGSQTVTVVTSPTQFKFTVYTSSNAGLIGIASSGDVGFVLHRGLNFTYVVTPGTDYTGEGGLRITVYFPLDARGFQILPVGAKVKVYGTSGENGTNIDGTWTTTTASSSTLTFLVPANYSSVSSSVPAGTGPQGVIVAKAGAGATLFRSVNDATQDRRIIGNIVLATNAANTGKLIVSNSKSSSTQVNNWRYNVLNLAASGGVLVNFADLSNAGAAVKNYTVATVSLLNSENSGVNMTGNVAGTPEFVDSASDNIRLTATDTLARSKYLDNVLVSTTDCDGLPAQVGTYMDIGAFERQ